MPSKSKAQHNLMALVAFTNSSKDSKDATDDGKAGEIKSYEI